MLLYKIISLTRFFSTSASTSSWKLDLPCLFHYQTHHCAPGYVGNYLGLVSWITHNVRHAGFNDVINAKRVQSPNFSYSIIKGRSGAVLLWTAMTLMKTSALRWSKQEESLKSLHYSSSCVGTWHQDGRGLQQVCLHEKCMTKSHSHLL